MNYYVYIDETGSFIKSKNKDTNYVGGWVCSHGTKKIKKQVDDAIQDYITRNALPTQFPIPDYLHFMPLHKLALRKKKDSRIRVPIKYVQPIVTEFFSVMAEKVFLVFRSKGFPRFYANEQAAYIEILRSTIYQLIDDLKLTDKDRLEIVIAARRVKILMGEFGKENIMDYENLLTNALRDELMKYALDARQLSEKQVKIVVSDARDFMPLAVADMFCGALRWKDHKYLKNFEDKIRHYHINDAFIFIPNRTTSIINNIYENDPGLGILRAFEALSKNINQKELVDCVNNLCRNISDEEKNMFNNELRQFLQEKLIDDPKRYQNLDQTSIFIDEVKQRFPKDYNILATLKFYNIKILSHKGSKNLKPFSDYCRFLDLHGPEAFGNMYMVAQEKIETILTIVQPAAFNIFKFERVEEYLFKEIERYNFIFPDVENRIDEIRARLEGTIGQMYGFLSDYPGKESLFDKALLHLQRDVNLCKKNSPFWKQGMGYLTSLFFRKKMLDKAIQSFMCETNSEKKNESDIYKLSRLHLFDSRKDHYFLLHRLYICALANKINKTTIESPEKLMEYLLKSNNISEYPVCQSAKWLSVIYAKQDDLENALSILQKIDTNPSHGFAIDIIKLPIKILIHLYQKKLNIESSFDLENELNLLELREKGIKSNLLSLGIHKFNDDSDYFDVAQVLPYYYA